MNETKPIKGYKVFDKDWKCRDFQFTCPGVFEEDVIPKVCDRGFHFCEKLTDCFEYYPFNPENKVAEVVALGEIETNGNKSCTNKLEIVRELSWHEVLDMVNTGKNCTGYRNSGNWNSGNWNIGSWNSGDWNIGSWNSGDWNSGNRNSGNWNSGNRNSGNRNSGDWNSGNCNSGDWNSGNWNKTNFSNGCFNTIEPKIYLFNKPSEWTYSDWLISESRLLLNRIDYRIMDWIDVQDMTEEEKTAHPEAKTTGGYLKKLDATKSAVTWWRRLSDDEKAVIKAIPNFDKAIFKEIVGVDIDAEDKP